MSSILSRYILKETALTWLAVTLVLLLILLTNQFAQVLGDAAAAKLPKDAVLAVMGFSSITYLTILMPLGMFLSVMLAMARFYRDSEMAAMMASGVGPLALYRPLITFALVLAAAVGYLSMDLVPRATQRVQIISEEAKQRGRVGSARGRPIRILRYRQRRHVRGKGVRQWSADQRVRATPAR